MFLFEGGIACNAISSHGQCVLLRFFADRAILNSAKNQREADGFDVNVSFSVLWRGLLPALQLLSRASHTSAASPWPKPSTPLGSDSKKPEHADQVPFWRSDSFQSWSSGSLRG